MLYELYPRFSCGERPLSSSWKLPTDRNFHPRFGGESDPVIWNLKELPYINSRSLCRRRHRAYIHGIFIFSSTPLAGSTNKSAKAMPAKLIINPRLAGSDGPGIHPGSYGINHAALRGAIKTGTLDLFLPALIHVLRERP